MAQRIGKFTFTLLVMLCITPATRLVAGAEEDILQLYGQDAVFTTIPDSLFVQLGWDLPDGGASVKAIADAAPGGAFDPRTLASLDATKLGYQAKWHEVRYKVYGLDWEIGGLQLAPNQPVAGVPTLVIIHGGSANWYEFFVDQFNNPGISQYLAQKVPVLLLTIPGNYKHGGWTETSYVERIPAYLLSKEITAEEAQVRNSVYTFRVVVEGVRQIIEKATTGPIVVWGHSTGGEIPYLLMDTPLQARMSGGYLGWGSGGPAMLDVELSSPEAHARGDRERFSQYAPVKTLRARSAGEYAFNSAYIGPLNPCKGADKLEVAECWFRQEERRRPQFKQKLQDMEHSGASELREQVAVEIRAALREKNFGVNPEEVLADLFSTTRVPLTGFKKMLYLIGKLDGHASIRDGIPSEARVANAFRKRNPQTPIRVALFDTPMTHYGYIERPKPLAAAMLAALKWLAAP
ncbi:MAG: alpha/beta fold hydrolase [Acidobacteria bacterium]|nr:alpha/beta fold hydrolase [Acidobacteriota bacterium]